MVFFKKKEREETKCVVCNEVNSLKKSKIAEEKLVCSECFKKTSSDKLMRIGKPIKKMTVEDIASAIKEKEVNDSALSSFNPTKKIGKKIEFDDHKQLWLLPSPFRGKRDRSTVYNYSDILGFELLEDGESVSQGGLGRALAGGVLFGGAGAVVGGVTGKKKNKAICTSLRIKISLKDINNPVEYIDFITLDTKKDGSIYHDSYNQAQECLSVFQLICDQQENEVSINSESKTAESGADEIRKFKELFDEGIITQEEYDVKKKELLGI